MFAAGSVQLLVAMAVWLLELQGSYLGLLPVPTWFWPPAWVHGGIMLYGIFGFFIFGFLMTALPKWMAAAPLAPGEYLPTFGLMALGWLLFYGGLALPLLAAPGLALAVVGWLRGAWVLGRVIRTSMNPRGHAGAAVAALVAGALGTGAYAWALLAIDATGFRLAVELGFWGFLAPVFFIVLHRMLPFFTGAVVRGYREYQPAWALWAMLAGLVGHGCLDGFELTAWRWLADLPTALLAAHLSWRWGLRSALATPMVAMLHLGALWLAAGLGLFALQSLLALGGVSWGGLLPLHAVGAGFFGSILIGMSTRVTLGHSGRPIAGDRWAWPLFLVFQGVVGLRLAGEFAGLANVAAAAGWLAVFGAWGAVHLPMYLWPRPDGRPG